MRGLDGVPEQCDVFFTNVRVPLDSCLGAENDGWSVAKYLLEHERGGGTSFATTFRHELALIRGLAGRSGDGFGAVLADDPVFQDRFTESEYRFEQRQHIQQQHQGQAPEHWQHFADMGWLGIAFAEEQASSSPGAAMRPSGKLCCRVSSAVNAG